MRDPFADLCPSERAELDAWLDSTRPMTEAEHNAFAREYAEAECATARFEQQYPHLAD